MIGPTKSLVWVTLLGLLLGGCGGGSEVKTSVDYTPSGSQGASAGGPSLASVSKDGPVLLYFAKKDCGSNSRAVPLVQSVYQPYEGKVKMFAVVNTTADGYAAWSKEFGTTLEGIPDKDMELTREMGLAESQHLVLVDKGGKTHEIEGGFGRDALVALNEALAAQAGVKAADIDLSRAPDGAAYG